LKYYKKLCIVLVNPLFVSGSQIERSYKHFLINTKCICWFMITFFYHFFFFSCHWIFRRKVMKATVSYCTNTKKKAVFGGRVSCDRKSSSPASSGSITESLLRLVVRQNRNKKLNWFTIDYLSGLASMCCKFHRFSAI
jgi:hypothetical protein